VGGGRRAAVVSALATLLISVASGCGSGDVTPDVDPRGVWVSFDERYAHPRVAYVKAAHTDIYVRLASGDRLAAWYSATTRHNDGTLLSESRWSRRRPDIFVSRDWQACSEFRGKPPEPRLRTFGDLLEDLVGPPDPPPGARFVRARPITWELVRGLQRLRIEQRASGQQNRVVRVGPARGPFTSTISNVRIQPWGALPIAREDWSACASRPSAEPDATRRR